jgi:hypothetical protein
MKNSHALNKDLKYGTSREFCWLADMANAVDAQERGANQPASAFMRITCRFSTFFVSTKLGDTSCMDYDYRKISDIWMTVLSTFVQKPCFLIKT